MSDGMVILIALGGSLVGGAFWCFVVFNLQSWMFKFWLWRTLRKDRATEKAIDRMRGL